MSTCAITFGGAQLILSGITLFNMDYIPTAWEIVLAF